MRTKILANIVMALAVLVQYSCQHYLDIKSDERFDLIDQEEELQALLDNSGIMNTTSASTPEIGSDNFFIERQDWTNLSSLTHKNAYIWDKDIFNETKNNDWFYLYRSVLYANIVLENLNKVQYKDRSNEKLLKSAALFYRTWSLFQVLQIWTLPYIKEKASVTPGIVYKVNSSFDEVNERLTLEESYARLIADLKASINELPLVSIYKTRPSKTAGYALLSRIYLSMNEYKLANEYADSCLHQQNSLLDYNNLTLSSNTPFLRYNDEVIFHASTATPLIMNNPRGKIDTVLYASYLTEDLRKKAFFRVNGKYQSFKGSYDGSTAIFCGLATDEVFLTKAECLFRMGKEVDGLNILVQLMKKRYLNGIHPTIENLDHNSGLALILNERRKELIYRQIRWMDLKRLNHGGGEKIIVRRKLGDQNYELSPGDIRYAFQIPQFVVQDSKIKQNE